MSTLVYQSSPKMTTAATKETPLQATYRRAAEEGDSWTWTPKVEGCLDVLLVRTRSHEANPELPPYEVTVTSCTCYIGAQGRLCKHLKRYRDDWAPEARMAKVEAAAEEERAIVPSYACNFCQDTGSVGGRWICRCAAGQARAQGRRGNAMVA